jgi:hypothetical protein
MKRTRDCGPGTSAGLSTAILALTVIEGAGQEELLAGTSDGGSTAVIAKMVSIRKFVATSDGGSTAVVPLMALVRLPMFLL